MREIEVQVIARYQAREIRTTGTASLPFVSSDTASMDAQAPGVLRQTIVKAGDDAALMLAAVTGDDQKEARDQLAYALERVGAYLAAGTADGSISGSVWVADTVILADGSEVTLQSNDVELLMRALS